MNELGQALMRMRVAAGLSVLAASANSGVMVVRLLSAERGVMDPYYVEVAALVSAYGHTMADLPVKHTDDLLPMPERAFAPTRSSLTGLRRHSALPIGARSVAQGTDRSEARGSDRP